MTPKEVIIAALNPSSLTSAELYKYADAVLSALSDAGMSVCREEPPDEQAKRGGGMTVDLEAIQARIEAMGRIASHGYEPELAVLVEDAAALLGELGRCRENHDAALAEVARLALELEARDREIERLRTENDVLRMKLASAQMLMSIARAALRSEGETP